MAAKLRSGIAPEQILSPYHNALRENCNFVSIHAIPASAMVAANSTLLTEIRRAWTLRSSNPNIVLGCQLAPRMACIEYPPRLDQQ